MNVESKPPIFLLGEAMGENELRIGAGFVGSSGIELLRMLNEAAVIELTSVDYDYLSRYYNSGDPLQVDMIWRLHPEVHRSNVFQTHPPGNRIEALCGSKDEAIPGYPQLIKGKGRGYVRNEFAYHLERLGNELLRIDPNLVVCLGNSALWAMCGSTGISKLRGTTSVSTYTASGYKCLGTYHPAAVLRQWELRPVTVADLIKASREAEYPEIRRPKREIWIEPTIEDLYEFYNQYIINCEFLSVDIETSGSQITCIGFGTTTRALVVPIKDIRQKDGNYWRTLKDEQLAWQFIKMVCESPIPKLGQNILYDVAFTWRSYGIYIRNIVHDDMLLHHTLQPESLKGLAFLGSVYANEGAWKSDRNKGVETIKRDA